MLKKSNRNELEITDINNIFIEKNCADYECVKGWWVDAGTFESYEKANLLVQKRNKL